MRRGGGGSAKGVQREVQRGCKGSCIPLAAVPLTLSVAKGVQRRYKGWVKDDFKDNGKSTPKCTAKGLAKGKAKITATGTDEGLAKGPVKVQLKVN